MQVYLNTGFGEAARTVYFCWGMTDIGQLLLTCRSHWTLLRALVSSQVVALFSFCVCGLGWIASWLCAWHSWCVALWPGQELSSWKLLWAQQLCWSPAMLWWSSWCCWSFSARRPHQLSNHRTPMSHTRSWKSCWNTRCRCKTFHLILRRERTWWKLLRTVKGRSLCVTPMATTWSFATATSPRPFASSRRMPRRRNQAMSRSTRNSWMPYDAMLIHAQHIQWGEAQRSPQSGLMLALAWDHAKMQSYLCAWHSFACHQAQVSELEEEEICSDAAWCWLWHETIPRCRATCALGTALPVIKLKYQSWKRKRFCSDSAWCWLWHLTMLRCRATCALGTALPVTKLKYQWRVVTESDRKGQADYVSLL